MGIQAYIEVKDLERNGASVEFTDHVREDVDYGGNPEVLRWTTALVTFKDGTQLSFACTAGRKALWVDVNRWGSNREVYLPVLEANGVPYAVY